MKKEQNNSKSITERKSNTNDISLDKIKNCIDLLSETIQITNNITLLIQHLKSKNRMKKIKLFQWQNDLTIYQLKTLIKERLEDLYMRIKI